MDSSSGSASLSPSGDTVMSKTNPIARTLAPVYASSASNSSLAWFMYNDQTPSGSTSSSRAHAKGVLSFDARRGFWFIHSVPRFAANQANGYAYEEGQTTYGQSMLCMTLGLSDINTVASQLQINYVNDYDTNLPPFAPQALTDIVNGDSASSDSNIATIRGNMGTEFTVFAKSKNWGKDLWEDLVAPRLGSGLYVETWMRPYMDSVCSPYKVENIKQLSISGVEWKETQDHAKWAISSDGQTVCVGDINRMESQRTRGGGCSCFTNPSLNAALTAGISEKASCPAVLDVRTLFVQQK